ncbi:MAG: hypothetical protein ACC742_13395 [Thermoanaerobaculales bacterium]
MPLNTAITIAFGETGHRVSIAGEFSDDEWPVLRDFVSYARELNRCRFVQGKRGSGLNIKWSQGKGVTYNVMLPPEDEFAAFLHRLRPFLLNNEPTYFHKIFKLLARRLDNKQFRLLIRPYKEAFSGKLMQSHMQITSDEIVLNSERILNDWLNGFEYHRDEKRPNTFRNCTPCSHWRPQERCSQ